MNKVRCMMAVITAFALVSINLTALQAQPPQRRRSQRRPTPRATTSRTPTAATDSPLTGLYRLDLSRSDDPREAAERAATFLLPGEQQQRVIDNLTTRLTAPDQIAIERRGRIINIGSTRAPRVSFEADGRTRTEQADDGHTVSTRATLYGDQLMVSSIGNRDDEFSVNFDSIDNGSRLRVTRRIRDAQIDLPVVVQSTYVRISNVARFNIYGEPEAARTASAGNVPRNRQQGEPRSGPTEQQPRQQPRPAPPVIRSRAPRPAPAAPPYEGFVIGSNMRFVTTLNDNLSTATSREGDRFTLTVSEPAVFAGAIIEGTVSRIDRGGRIAGRSEMTLNFERIRLRDGRTQEFAAVVESVRAPGGEDVRVDNERGNVQERDSQTNRTTERAAIGAAVGAIIGAISGGGRGAAIGAVIGAGAGAGSVYAQGRDDLDLNSGTELIIRTTRTTS
ncbi:MAG: YMGG-like glycine zipper-containing protein [Pyrinomonadaceae bacterium]